MEGTDLLTKAMATPNKLAQTLHDVLIPAASHLAPFTHALVNRLSGLAIAYHGSPIIEGDGKRCFDDTLRGGRGIARDFLLLCDPGDEAAMHDQLHRLSERLSSRVDVRGVHRGDALLVRPDGYIACSGRSASAMVDSVRSVVELQLH